MITTITDIGAQAATKLVVALAYLALLRRLAGSAEISPGFRDGAPDFGVLAASIRFLTFRTLVDAVSSIALALFGQPLAFVRLALRRRVVANHPPSKRLGRVGAAIARARKLPVSEQCAVRAKMGKSPHDFVARIHDDRTMKHIAPSTLMRRIAVRSLLAALLSGGWGWTGVRDGTAHADDNGWGPPHHWCPGQTPVPATGNHITDPLNWDWNVCHTYYFLCQGMGNVSNMIWDGDNPPPKPPPPIGLYCAPATLTNCRIGDHP